MSAGPGSLCSTLLFSSILVFVSADQKTVLAVPGQDVTLPCQAPDNKPVTGVKWSREDIRDKNVFLYHKKRFDTTNQHPFFKNRVDLKDRQMKDGDVSLILKDVIDACNGKYQCHVFIEKTHSWKSIRTIRLGVVPPDMKTITAVPGQDVTLPCRVRHSNITILVFEWKRADLGDEYVLLYHDGYFVPQVQHPSFKNRVDVQERQMKDGDVSLILKDVTIYDAGTYECHALVLESLSREVNIISLSVVDPPDQKNITAESGQDVTLTCRALNNNIRAVEWSRADLGDEYVLLYRDGRFEPDDQHPSFKNRVDLQDRQMKDGDVSLILKEVTINDAGTYECHVVQGQGLRIITIYLRVDPPENGSVGLKVGLSVIAVLLFAVVVFFYL
ncbi:hypothetical protein ACER0C_002368 [Sarotherodon galilaeus]